MLRAVSAGAAFLLFLGGRRVGNAGMSVFSVFVRGLREEKVYLANLAVLLRGLYADHVKRLGFFRSLRGRCAAKAGLLCFAVYLRGRPMGIRVFGAPLRELTAGDRPISGFLRPPFRAWAGIGRAERHIFFFYAFLWISFFPCALLK